MKNDELETSQEMQETETQSLQLIEREDVVKETGTEMLTRTTIQDKKLLFNIENGECDVKLNDIVGEEIEVTNIFMKRIESKLKEEELEINEETGEVIKDSKISVITILIDKENKKYVTASKIFAMSILNLIRTFGVDDIQKGIKIRIIKKSIKNSPNKALGFELV